MRGSVLVPLQQTAGGMPGVRIAPTICCERIPPLCKLRKHWCPSGAACAESRECNQEWKKATGPHACATPSR